MKMNVFVLALASLLMSNNAFGARVPVTFEHPGKPATDKFFELDLSHGPKSLPVKFTDVDWHQRFENAGLRNFHAEGSGLQGLEVSSTKLLEVTPSAVPVPAAMWLFMSGLIGMIGVMRRKRPRKD